MSDTITTLLRTCDTLKARLSGSRPLPIEALRKIEEAFNIEYTYESNRIEGNTLTLQETELVVNKGIHPFIDGNGRTSRLLMNLYLLRNGYTLVNLRGSNEAKLAYYNALETSHMDKRPEAFQRLVAEAEKLLENGFRYARHSDYDFYFELALPYGRMLIGSGRYGEAETFLSETLDEIDRNDNIRYRYQVLELLSELYDRKGDTDDSYRFYKMAVSSRDSILNVNKDASFNSVLNLYEDATMQNILLQRKYDMYVIAFVCILSILAGAFFFYRYFQQNRLYKELIRHYQDYMKRTERLRKYLNREDAPKEEGAADEALFSKLEKLMTEDRVYRSNEVSLDKLASMLGTNRTYISRVINRYADKSFWGYINMYRIADATSMLSDPDNDIPIKNIYEILGYNSPASFFRVFKDEVGCSPSTYREQVRRMGEQKEIL